MTTDFRLEKYLNALESALKPFPVSDRAEIITEIKSHILSAVEKDPNTNLESVLAALGEPEIVANRYLIERGLKPNKPPISPVVKWIVIGFLGTVALVILAFVLMLSYLSPLIKVDEQSEKVSLLGGAIQIDGKEGRVFIDGAIGERRRIVGAADVEPGQNISIQFNHGRFTVETSDDEKLTWRCRAISEGKKDETVQPITENGKLSLDFSATNLTRCKLKVPVGALLTMNGTNGRIYLKEPQFGVNVELTNGRVSFEPDDDSAYQYNLSVVNGTVDSFQSSDKPNAHSINIRLTNGQIRRAE